MNIPQVSVRLASDGTLLAESTGANGARQVWAPSSLEEIRQALKDQATKIAETEAAATRARHDRVMLNVATKHNVKFALQTVGGAISTELWTQLRKQGYSVKDIAILRREVKTRDGKSAADAAFEASLERKAAIEARRENPKSTDWIPI